MAFDFATVLETVRNHLEGATDANGQPLFATALIGEPNGPEPAGASARVTVRSAEVVSTTLTHAIELHTLNVRLYRGEYVSDEQVREVDTAVFVSRVMDLFYGDFTLGAGIRNIDIGGQHSSGLSVEFTTDETREATYHVADITLPLIVDSATTFAA